MVIMINPPIGKVTVCVSVTTDLCSQASQCLEWVWHIGAEGDTSPEDRFDSGGAVPATGRVDVIMDLKADKKRALSGGFKDEPGNTVPVPAGAVVTYTVDDSSLINLTDNGDGTAVAASTGVLGTANVHAEASFNGRTLTGDLQLVVVASDAERFEIVAGEEEEVTPDV